MAAIILNQTFIYKWNVNIGANGSYDYIDYMTRPGVFNENLHYQKDDMYYDYLNYMKNSDKSDGAFDSDTDILSKEQLDNYRKLEVESQRQGCPKYLGIISFENKFLKDNNIMNSFNEIDHGLLKEYTRQGINALIKTSKKLKIDNVYWVASIHENTDNIHVHYELLEYKRCENRCKKYKDKDMIETKAFEKLKSKMANLISPRIEMKNNIIKISRELAKTDLKEEFTNTDSRIANLHKIINSSSKPRKWQYGSYEKTDGHAEDPMKEEIDSVVKNIIMSNDKLADKFNDLNHMLNDFDKYNIYLYGHRKKYLKMNENTLKI